VDTCRQTPTQTERHRERLTGYSADREEKEKEKKRYALFTPTNPLPGIKYVNEKNKTTTNFAKGGGKSKEREEGFQLFSCLPIPSIPHNK
jgi:hypothetical protein